MPTYGYRCPSCGSFELVRPMAEASDPACCPDCGEVARRVFGGPALRRLEPGVRRALDAEVRSS
ncbi:MAG: putative regulatory protein FmdB family, partial [Pseudonocardia sp.]|nr:putative regulatory protein FmdB family [Pseudonocardia sp.]